MFKLEIVSFLRITHLCFFDVSQLTKIILKKKPDPKLPTGIKGIAIQRITGEYQESSTNRSPASHYILDS